MKGTKRLLALLLAACMGLTGMAVAEGEPVGEETPAPVVTDSPTPPPTEAPTPTEKPTSAPTEAPTPTPTPRLELTKEPTATPTEAPTPTPTSEPTEKPTEAPTEAPIATPTEEPTPTPTTEPTDEPTEGPTEAPTATPTGDPTPTPSTEPTDEPTEGPTEEPTATPTGDPTPTPSTEPTDEPTEGPTEEPTTTPTGDPTPTPSTEPTDGPTEGPTAEPSPSGEPTETPTPTPVILPTAEPWDESQCDHTSLECEQAPKCDVEDCEHVTVDANGLPIPVCDAGLWLLDVWEKMDIQTYSIRSQPIDLNLADATIYRSGRYLVEGGNLRPGASLRVVKNRLVVLELRDATLDTLTIESGAQGSIFVTLGSTAAMKQLRLSSNAEASFGEGGAVRVNDCQNSGKITIKGCSVNASLREAGGRTLHVFPAEAGEQTLQIGERTYRSTPDTDGNYYLWLPAAQEGLTWQAIHVDGVMQLSQAEELPKGTEADIRPGEENTLESGHVYTLTGAIAAGTRLLIHQSDITVVLDNAQATGTLIEASCAYDLTIRGETSLRNPGGAVLRGGPVRVMNEGRLIVDGTLPDGIRFVSGTAVLSEVPAGYSAYAAGVALTNQRVLVDGANAPLLMNADGSLLLPTPEKGKTYAITADETTVSAETVDEGEKLFILSTKIVEADAGDAAVFTVRGALPGYVTGRVVAANATASASFENVRLQNAGATLALTAEHLSVALKGDNALVSSSGNPISLKDGSTVALNVRHGRLLLRGQSDLSGVTLQGNVKVEPEPSLPHITLMIRDENGNPVPNRDLTVALGGYTYRYTTHFDGTLSLWGFDNLTGQDVAASDGQNVYTAVLVGQSAEVVKGLSIENVQLKDQKDGSVLVTFDCEGAGTAGVQLLYGREPQEMPDAYVSGARQVAAKDGRAVLTGFKAGDTVTLRVYVTTAENAVLTASSDDGFQFSDVYTHVCRAVWKPGKSADVAYTGKPYRPPFQVPEKAKITYTGDALDENGRPVRPGDYVMHVEIPEGDPKYLPGKVDVKLTIEKLTVTIHPAPNQEKMVGTEDPALFDYTAEGLLEGDTLGGLLTRVPGEFVGNYDFLLAELTAPDYYKLVMQADPPTFTITPSPRQGPSYAVNEVMTPVRQSIVRKDGRSLSVLINTQDNLNISGSELGNVVRNSSDEAIRPFTPSMSWNRETDGLLLRLRAEAELSYDQGYVTDSYGNPVWGGRTLRLSWMSVNHMRQLGIDAISLSNKDAAVTVYLSDFLSEEVQKRIKTLGGNLTAAVFRVSIVPRELPEGASAGGWQVSATVSCGGQMVDILPLLPSATVAVDMEPVAELLAGLKRYDEATFRVQFALVQGEEALDWAFVAPYEEEEMTLCDFPCLLYTDRYLLAPLTQPGLVYVSMQSIPETSTSAGLRGEDG